MIHIRVSLHVIKNAKTIYLYLIIYLIFEVVQQEIRPSQGQQWRGPPKSAQY